MSQDKTMEITRGSDNVFEDLGFEPKEAEELKQQADLMLDLRQLIREHQWNSKKAATFLGQSTDVIKNLINGEIDEFNIEQLENTIAKAKKLVSGKAKQPENRSAKAKGTIREQFEQLKNQKC